MYIYKIKIQLDKEEEEETLKQKEKKELHSDCSLYESWPRETYVRTYICTFDRIMIECKPQKHCRSNSKKQLGDITIDTPYSLPFSLRFYINILFLFHIVRPPPHSTLHTGPFLPSNPNQIKNQPTKQKKLW